MANSQLSATRGIIGFVLFWGTVLFWAYTAFFGTQCAIGYLIGFGHRSVAIFALVWMFGTGGLIWRSPPFIQFAQYLLNDFEE
jgi:hypothetical protein